MRRCYCDKECTSEWGVVGPSFTAQAVISGLWFGGALPNGDGRCLHLLVTLITVRVGGGYKERRRFRKDLKR